MKNNNYKKAFNLALAGTVAVSAVVVAVAPASANVTSFKDVTSNNVHYADIMKLVEGKYINGFEDGTYRPSVSVTRGQAAKIIANVLGLDTTNVDAVTFKDVAKSNIYYGPIAALAKSGIINGFEDNTYRPDDTLTRGQMAKIIAASFKLQQKDTKNPFTDAEKSIYKDSILALFANGVTTGKTATTYAPDLPVTRGELASFVVRADQSNLVGTKFTILSIENGKVNVAGDQLEVAPHLAAVFSADNAAALKAAEVQLVVEYTTETVATLAPVAATVTGKIIGIESLKFVAENTKFNAGGVEIPVVETAAGMTISNVVAEELTIKGNVTLENVTVESLTITGNAKITIGKNTKIENLIIEEGKTLADVIANYEEVKNQLTDVVVKKVPAGTTPSTGGGGGGAGSPSTGGGSGNGGSGSGDGNPGSSEATPLDKVIKITLDKLNTAPENTFAKFELDEANDIINVTVTQDTEISNIRKKLKEASTDNELSYQSLIDLYSADGVDTLLAAALGLKIKVGNSEVKTIKMTDYLAGKDILRKKLVDDIDDYIHLNTTPGSTLEQIASNFDEKITFTTTTNVTYKVKFKK